MAVVEGLFCVQTLHFGPVYLAVILQLAFLQGWLLRGVPLCTSNFLPIVAVITLAFRPDGAQLAVSSLDGQISFWDIANSVQTGSIEGRQDLQVGRRETDKVTARKLAGSV